MTFTWHLNIVISGLDCTCDSRRQGTPLFYPQTQNCTEIKCKEVRFAELNYFYTLRCKYKCQRQVQQQKKRKKKHYNVQSDTT